MKIFRKVRIYGRNSIHDEGNTSCHVPQDSRNARNRNSTSICGTNQYGTNTSYDTIENQTLRPVSTVDGIQKILNCRRNDLTERTSFVQSVTIVPTVETDT